MQSCKFNVHGNHSGWGNRVILRAKLASARETVQVDVGFGDAAVPPPVEVKVPTLLGSPKPKLRA